MNARLALLLAALCTAACAPLIPQPSQTGESGLSSSKLTEESLALGSLDEELSLDIPTAEARKTLLGKWYGITRTADGGRKEWLVNRAVDGTYRIDFRVTDAKGQVSAQSEVGFWGVSGGVYFRIFRGWVMLDGMKTADPTDPGHYDSYEVVSLTGESFQYRHIDNNTLYTVKKMPADFTLLVPLDAKREQTLKFEF
ncbi:hypothetical protein I6N98_00480 [Spongiibacter nanhainus]|uniref:Uncharacterized protein n=1 Tax=Spongiibacter nanhainus TaxID=2794344 RepID=A0A7T4R0Y0_9GAMM|nr:hypothetical protein [Spongiibacter nanhainus]QQD18388.1 hypothetical protein I6N98_00480 [Spongiibacter nanhainus]